MRYSLIGTLVCFLTALAASADAAGLREDGAYPWGPVLDANQQTTPPSAPKVTLGLPQAIPFANGNIKYGPDGHVSFHRTEHGGYRVFLPSSAGNSYMCRGDSFDSLDCYKSNSNPVPVLVPGTNPDKTSYNYDYDGINSVIPIPHKGLLCFTEAENHPNRPSTTGQIHSIGSAFSDDGGITWHGNHQTIDQPKLNAGLPSAIVVNLRNDHNDHDEKNDSSGADCRHHGSDVTPTIYCYYIGWFHHSDPNQPAMQRSTCLATQPLSAMGDASQWKFVGPVFTGGAAHISYNVDLREFIAVFADYTNEYRLAASYDGINWGPSVDLGFSNQYPYPTLVCPSQPVSMLSSTTGYLYYENGGLNCYRRAITLSK